MTVPSKRLGTWLIPVFAIALLGEAVAWLLFAQGGSATAPFVRYAAWGAAYIWFMLGLFARAQTRYWLWGLMYFGLLGGGLGLMLLLRMAFGEAFALLCYLVAAGASILLVHRAFKPAPQYRVRAVLLASGFATAWASAAFAFQGHTRVAIALAGIGAMALGFGMGMTVLLSLLAGRRPVFGVANAVLQEAMRMRAALVLIIFVIASLPILPLVLDEGERLTYRMQFFLTWSLSGITLLFGAMTVFLACGTIARDLETKHIFLTLTKPIRRWEYLMGKWMGIAALNLLLVALTGIGVYSFVLVLEQSPAKTDTDRDSIRQEVMVARAAIDPVHPDQEGFRRSIEEQIESQRLDAGGELGAETIQRIRGEAEVRWLSLPPKGKRAYKFAGLSNAKRMSDVVQLRFRPMAMRTTKEQVDASFRLWLNGREWPLDELNDGRHATIEVPSNMYHMLRIPTEHIDEQGNLVVEMLNESKKGVLEKAPPEFRFMPGQLEMLYRVGGFEGNYFRCLVVMALKLFMLAAVGLTAASALDFPVACLFALMVFAVAGANDFLAEALKGLSVVDRPDADIKEMVTGRWGWLQTEWDKGEYWLVVKMIGAMLAEAIVSFWPSFSEYDTVGRLADGRVVTWGNFFKAILVIGLIWPLLIGMVGWWLFERRDVARVVV